MTIWTFVGKVMSLLCNMLSRFVIAFLPRSKHLLISWVLLLSTVILESKKRNLSLFPHFPFFCPESDGTGCHDLSLLNVEIQAIFLTLLFHLIKRLFSSSSFSANRVASSSYLRSLIFFPANLVPPCDSSSPAFLMIRSAYKLNKQGDNTQL